MTNQCPQHLLVRKKPKHFYDDYWQAKLARFLHNDSFHNAMNVLLIFDLSILIVSMQLELYYLISQIDSFSEACHDHAHTLQHYGDHALHEAEQVLTWVSISILIVFLIENVLVLLSEGSGYLDTPMHALDFIVVALSLYFELGSRTFAATILLISRTWRFIRMVHGTHVLDSDLCYQGCNAVHSISGAELSI